jgi:hypothetical protein
VLISGEKPVLEWMPAPTGGKPDGYHIYRKDAGAFVGGNRYKQDAPWLSRYWQDWGNNRYLTIQDASTRFFVDTVYPVSGESFWYLGDDTLGSLVSVGWDEEECPDEVIVMHKTAGNVEYLHRIPDSFDRIMFQNKEGTTFNASTLFKNFMTIEGKPCGYQKKMKRIIKGIDASAYTITKQEKERITKEFEEGTLKKVIATKIWSEGINVKHCRFFFRANGSASKNDSIQMPGRLSRLMEGKENAVLLDIYDDFNAEVKRKAEMRRKEYQKQGWLK